MSRLVIPLSRGLVSLVDECDFEMFSCFAWHARSYNPAAGKFYGARRARLSDGTYKLLFLHREILGCELPLVVDHINGRTNEVVK